MPWEREPLVAFRRQTQCRQPRQGRRGPIQRYEERDLIWPRPCYPVALIVQNRPFTPKVIVVPLMIVVDIWAGMPR